MNSAHPAKRGTIVTQEILFRGTVQGVGFRPTVAGLARSLGMVGQVRNMGGSVELIVTDTEARIEAFVRAIEKNKPVIADIAHIESRVIDTVLFRGFSIAPSGGAENEAAVLPADIAVCGDCLREFYDEQNPRFKHPFISCAVCGPRFTIMERLPYDRDTTTMDDFEMCDFCAGAYADAGDRRFHAQTISCHVCGPIPEWLSAGITAGRAAIGTKAGAATEAALETKTGASATEAAIDALRNGGVVALKGVGGYYFACDPFNASAVRKLRAIKRREEKPFAVLFRDVEGVCAQCAVRPEEAELLTSPKRPIVLLERSRTETAQEKVLTPGVCNSSRFLGAFLPSMGLQYLMADALGPLVMTSANLSDFPIIKDDDEMRALVLREGRIAGMLYHRRRIAVRVDDSVIRVIDGLPQQIRRSKGYAPAPVLVRGVERLTPTDRIFATGGQLKTAFSLSKGNFVYMSQYIGDLSGMESERVYRENFYRMKLFFDIEPDLVVCDMHPLYDTTKFAETYAETARPDREKPALLRVQHHHAHTASVMAEHGLSGPVIGVAFDGVGYGTDGRIWGGEILICEQGKFTRFSHLKYVKLIGGDASMKDGWKSAVCHVLARGDGAHRQDDPVGIQDGFHVSPGEGRIRSDGGSAEFDIDISGIVAYSKRTDALRAFGERRQVEAAIRAEVGTVESSSMGRLFDGVASLLGIHHINRYEGECAIMLENAAAFSLERAGGGDCATGRNVTPCRSGSCARPEAANCRAGRQREMRFDEEAASLALRFHTDVAAAVLKQCRAARLAHKTETVALSGGVFQNKILMEETLARLRQDGFTVYYNVAVPPNDGGIALGQTYIGMQRLLARRYGEQ
ncbi:MAG: carbamoyltransferase HypF [Clostridiales Family XIII bacterium]|jgi:hydrogenase maturation protein HypF|nr:carbamoyltransferase HypF [Clostridiales Family XIII bacterium]